eukprot:g2242.t1
MWFLIREHEWKEQPEADRLSEDDFKDKYGRASAKWAKARVNPDNFAKFDPAKVTQLRRLYDKLRESLAASSVVHTAPVASTNASLSYASKVAAVPPTASLRFKKTSAQFIVRAAELLPGDVAWPDQEPCQFSKVWSKDDLSPSSLAACVHVELHEAGDGGGDTNTMSDALSEYLERKSRKRPSGRAQMAVAIFSDYYLLARLGFLKEV